MMFCALYDYVHPESQEILIVAGATFEEGTFWYLVELGFDHFNIFTDGDIPYSITVR